MRTLKDLDQLTTLGRRYREDEEYRISYLNRILEKKHCEICDKYVCDVNFARHCRGKKHLILAEQNKPKTKVHITVKRKAPSTSDAPSTSN